MSYQALARKWRPKQFADLVGQEHVVRGLTNALERGRLHHAYLLTGTRGVGKTTIARVLAKCLNCATGVTATPCGVCPACVDIDAGRFVDLLELDAASNTSVDNMREILDNARYAPTVGRYKVYLIDEVHMLSRSAFNSMLKTLEEPPEHVKFILATTDPQRIPVTVLSRCLQFNLKALPPARIAARLGEVLAAEGIAGDPAALMVIAHSAQGSMRDALSVLDQAIAYGAGEVREGTVRAMLGAADAEYVYRIVDALLAGDGKVLLTEAAALEERSLSPAAALDDLASLFHRIAVAQTVADATDVLPDAQRIADYARAFPAEAVQLAYQICVQGRADLALAPDEGTGFAMTLLRLLAFEPARQTGTEAGASSEGIEREPTKRPASVSRSAPSPVAEAASTPAPAPATGDALPVIADWPTFVAGLKLSGITLQLAAQTALKSAAGNELVLTVPEAARHLTDKVYADKLKTALESALGRRVRVRLDVGGDETSVATLAAQDKRERADVRARTEAAFRDDPFVQDVLARFDGTIKSESIKPSS